MLNRDGVSRSGWRTGFALVAILAAWAVVIKVGPPASAEAMNVPIWTDAVAIEPEWRRDFIDFTVGPDGSLFGLGFTSTGDGYDYLESLRLIAVKIAPDGRELWRRLLPSHEPMRGIGMIPAPDGGLFVCDGVQNIYRLDADGATLWHVVTGEWMDLICDEFLYQSEPLLLVAGERRFVAWPDNWRDHEAALTAFDAATGDQLWQVGYSPFDQLFLSGSTVLATEDRLIWFGAGYAEDHPYRHSFNWSFDIGFDGSVLARSDLTQLFEEDDFAEHRQIIVNEDNQLILMGRYPGGTGIGFMVWDAPRWRKPREYRYAPEYLLDWENETHLSPPSIVESTDNRLTTLIVRYPDEPRERVAIGLATKIIHAYDSFEIRTIYLSTDLPRGTILWDRQKYRPFSTGGHFFIWQRGENYPSFVPATIWRIDLE